MSKFKKSDCTEVHRMSSESAKFKSFIQMGRQVPKKSQKLHRKLNTVSYSKKPIQGFLYSRIFFIVKLHLENL